MLRLKFFLVSVMELHNYKSLVHFQMLRLKFFLVSVMELHNYKTLVHFPTNKLLPEINYKASYSQPCQMFVKVREGNK
ncbi:hypothetical protein MANES_10G083466v8 [Manihot esculenta]|uniref:Uncharacterized protein n=1 Tax=Manihot esculenta TaxID=3983 RepID=A0ACB7H422_MANES|nr:hypothetical protein MANES_10G083466v8 [Manihot esculenta]